MRIWLYSVLVLVVGFNLASADPDKTPPPTIEAAIKTAMTTGKPLLIEFYTDWCGPCKRFEAEVMPDARVKAALNDVVFTRYNAEEEPGESVAERFGVNSYPTFLAIDNQGTERLRRGGTPGGEAGITKFIELLGEVRAAVENEASVRARVKAAPANVDVLLSAARWYVSRSLWNEALRHYDAIAANSKAPEQARAEAWGAAAQLRRRDDWKSQLLRERVELIRRFPKAATVDDLTIATVESGLPPAEIKSLFAIVFTMQDDADSLNASTYVALAAGAND